MIEDFQQPVHAYEDGFFNVASGRLINIHNPTPSMINIQDIAAGLSRICRFGGHINQHYSVAQHSVYVSVLAREKAESLATIGLLHDATEAYIGDVIKPLKHVLGKAYEHIEDRFEATIFRRFSIQESCSDIKQFDRLLLTAEYEYFFPKQTDSWSSLRMIDRIHRIFSQYYNVQLKDFKPWSADLAEYIFLQVAQDLNIK